MRLFAQRSDLARVSSFVGAYSASVVGLECLLHKANFKEITPAISGLDFQVQLNLYSNSSSCSVQNCAINYN